MSAMPANIAEVTATATAAETLPGMERFSRVVAAWAARQTGYDWLRTLKDDASKARRINGEWWVAGALRLPSSSAAPNMTVATYCEHWKDAAPGAPRVPDDFESWSDRERREWREMESAVKLREEFRAAHPELTERKADAEFFRAHGFSEPTLRRFRRKLADGRKKDSRGRPADPDRTGSWEWGQVRLFELFASNKQPSLRNCWRIIDGEAKRSKRTWPPYYTVRRWVRSQERFKPFFMDLPRRGMTYWKRNHLPRIHRDFAEIQAGQVWVADHHRLDLLAMHNGKPVRPWLTCIIDQKSRKVLGWHISAHANSDTILRAFAMAVRKFGGPQSIVVDNGRDFSKFAGWRRHSEDELRRLESTLAPFNVRVIRCRPYEPGGKNIERFFGTVRQFVTLPIPECAAYVGNRPDARPENLYRDIRAGEIAVPEIAPLAAAFGRWADDIYANQPHTGEGMNGRSPNAIFGEDPYPMGKAPIDVIERMLWPARIATVTRRGVCFGRIYYGESHPSLWQRHGDEVLVRCDPDQANEVRIYGLDGGEVGKEICVAYNDRLTGATADDIREGGRRQHRATRLAKSAIKQAAFANRMRSAEEHTLDVLAERLEPLEQTGTDDRPMRLLENAGAFRGETPKRKPAAQPPRRKVNFDFGMADEPEAAPFESKSGVVFDFGAGTDAGLVESACPRAAGEGDGADPLDRFKF